MPMRLLMPIFFARLHAASLVSPHLTPISLYDAPLAHAMPELSHVGIIPAPEGVDTPEWALRMACASGASYSEIGVKCGLTKDAACKRAKKMGISNRMGIEALGLSLIHI